MSRVKQFLVGVGFFERPGADRSDVFPIWPEGLPASEILGPEWEQISVQTWAEENGAIRRWSLQGDGQGLLAVLFSGHGRESVEKWLGGVLGTHTAPLERYLRVDPESPLDEFVLQTERPPAGQDREWSRIWTFRNLGLDVLGFGTFDPQDADPVAKLSRWLGGIAGVTATVFDAGLGGGVGGLGDVVLDALPEDFAHIADQPVVEPQILEPEVESPVAGEIVVIPIFDPDPDQAGFDDYQIRVQTLGEAFDFVGVEPAGPRFAVRPGNGGFKIDVIDRRTLQTFRIERHFEGIE